MRSLALTGQRTAALAQYETCRRLLGEELGVEPGEETTKLYEQVRDSAIRRHAGSQRSQGGVGAAPAPMPVSSAVKPPSFLDQDETPKVERPVFVAREPELLQLDEFLELALAGRGRAAFVTGDAGSGKTALLHAFSRRAEDLHEDVIVATGNCNAYTGTGDPYSPFRQILSLLTGDVEAGWAAGVITRERARRLWSALPATARAIVEHGPDLIDAFVPGRALLERATIFGPGALGSESEPAALDSTRWLARLNELVTQRPDRAGSTGPLQLAIFGQYTRVLQVLAREAPLVLMLDDLQWADAGSIDLLFHLARQLAGSRVLIVGA
jgi:predicted ATPase